MTTPDHLGGDPPPPEWGGQPSPPAVPGWSGAGGAPPQTNSMAVGALVASILGFFCGVGFVIGLILGYNARKQIRASGGQEGGEGAATAAIVIGWIGVGLMVLGLIVVVVLGFFFALAPAVMG